MKFIQNFLLDAHLHNSAARLVPLNNVRILANEVLVFVTLVIIVAHLAFDFSAGGTPAPFSQKGPCDIFKA